MNAYGSCLSRRQEFMKADSLLVKGYQILKKTRGITDTYTKQALKRIVNHYQEWKKPEKARQFQAILSNNSKKESI